MTSRTAACLCGSLSAEAQGEPYGVNICHCTACQRRSGAVFGSGAYYRETEVAISGERRSFTRKGSTGGDLTNYFCPTCGTNLYWTTAMHPGAVGIAVGAFADPGFPPPQWSVWEATRHAWVQPPMADRFVEASSGPRVTPSA